MGWLSDLFNRKPYGPDIAFNCNVPMPTVKSPKPEKDISEPVYAIVKAMQERPSNFKLKRDVIPSNSVSNSISYTVKDVKTGESIQAVKRYRFIFHLEGNLKLMYSLSWGWLTQEEQSLLIETCYDIQENKLQRLRSIREVRKSIADKEARSRLQAIYK